MKPSLRTVVLVALIPTLLALTIFQAFRVHDAKYEAIIERIDRQMLGVGDAVSVRLDGDKHAALQKRVTDELASAEDLTGLFDAEDPFIVSHREIFQALRERLGLTYLYTQVYLGEDRIYYLLDGTPGDDWTPPGTTDVLPNEASIKGTRQLLAFGEPWVTDLVKWDNWGLIKASYTPLRTSDGEVVAMVGADLDSTIVRTETRRAFFYIVLFGFATITTSLFISVRASGSLTQPIAGLRDFALSIAAGNPPTKPVRSRLREVDALATKLQELNRMLEEKQKKSEAYLQTLSVARTAGSGKPESSGLEADPAPTEGTGDEALGQSAVGRALFLHGMAPWNQLSTAEILIVAQSCLEIRFPAGKKICQGGFVPEHFHLIREGAGEAPDGSRWEQVIGARAILASEALSTDVIAAEEGCRTLALPQAKLLALVSYRPELREGLLALEKAPEVVEV